MIGQTISHYKILEKLGEGGMGIVYKAQDTDLDRVVALKFLPHYLTSDLSGKERFYHEARAASSLNHPNITIIHEIREYGDQLFLAMEYVEGKTLKRLVEAEALSIKKVLEIAIQVCDGLHAAHEKGIVHRDIKSDNIMITPKGQVKIMDFGLAKVKGATKLTKAGSTIGTAAYMSPEQAQGEEVDQRSDIFSFGVVLYELLTAKLPFRGEHQAALMYSLINEEPQPVARYNDKVSADLERVLLKSLSKDREERYQHIDEMLADLRRERKNLEYARVGYATAIAPAQPAPVAPPGGRKKITRYLIIGAAIVTAMVAFVIFNPFNFEISQQKSTAKAERSALAVMYFENIPEPDDKDHTGEMLTNLLTTSLFQTKDLDVISRERLYDIQKELGQADAKTITPSMATKIAQRANVSMMLLGSILQKQPSLAVTYRLIEVKSGKILSTQRLAGFPADRIFALVDTLALLVKNDLQVVPAAPGETKSVATVTTKSPEAYRSYLEGSELNNRFYVREAKAAYQRALELDSNFAMAYYRLATLNLNDITQDKFVRLTTKAYQLSGALSDRERWSIQSLYFEAIEKNQQKAEATLEELITKYPSEQGAYIQLAYFYLRDGRVDKAEVTYKRGLQNDSLDKNLWNVLAYLQAGMNRKQDAIATIDRYLRIAPAEANPYDSKGDIYAVSDDYDSARVWWSKALTFRPDFPSVGKLFQLSLINGDTASASSYFKSFAATKHGEESLLGEIAPLPLLIRGGKIAGARTYQQTLLAEHRAKKLPQWVTDDLRMLVYYDYELRDYPAMLRDAREFDNDLKKDATNNRVGSRTLLALACAKTGAPAEAAALLDQLMKDRSNERDMIDRAAYDLAAAVLFTEQENFKGALDLYMKWDTYSFSRHAPQYHAAISLLKTGRTQDAILEFSRMTRWIDIGNEAYDLSQFVFWIYRYAGFAGVKAHYWLGECYEQAGDKQKALQEYEAFTQIWKNADFPSPELRDAKERILKLRETASR